MQDPGAWPAALLLPRHLSLPSLSNKMPPTQTLRSARMGVQVISTCQRGLMLVRQSETKSSSRYVFLTIWGQCTVLWIGKLRLRGASSPAQASSSTDTRSGPSANAMLQNCPRNEEVRQEGGDWGSSWWEQDFRLPPSSARDRLGG